MKSVQTEEVFKMKLIDVHDQCEKVGLLVKRLQLCWHQHKYVLEKKTNLYTILLHSNPKKCKK